MFERIFRSKNIFDPKRCGPKDFVAKIFGYQKYMVQKKIDPQKLRSTKNWVQKAQNQINDS